MKHLIHWLLALLAITTVASFSGAWTNIQDPQKKERKLGPPGSQPERIQGNRILHNRRTGEIRLDGGQVIESR